MSETARHVKLVEALGGKNAGNPATESWRIRPDIDRDIEYRSREDADELVLRMRFELQVEAAEHSGFGGAGLVVLRPVAGNAGGGEAVGLPGLGEEAALVAITWRYDLDNTHSKRIDLHWSAPSSATRRK